MRIKNMPRFIFSMSIIFIFVISICSLITTKVFSYQAVNYEEIIVSSGDTLWSIASEYNGNISENIYNIKVANNLENSEIYIGQILKIPVK